MLRWLRRGDLARTAEDTHAQIVRLKLLTTILPALAVVLYETTRDLLWGDLLSGPGSYLLVGLVAVVLTWGFSELVFGIVERLEAQALARSREVAALAAMMGERERLGRELHDGLAQLVAYILVRIDTVTRLVTADRRAEAVEELERLRGVADDLYADVRESITGLRTRVSERGLLPAVREYLEEFEERHGIAVALRADRALDGISPLAEFQLFRIVQEALTNVRKHAGADRAWVSFTCREPDTVVLVIADYGQGFDPARVLAHPVRSHGMGTMRERALGVGAEFRVESRPGSGTRITVKLPLGEAERREGAPDGETAAAAAR